MQLQICGSHVTCKVANKCLNVLEPVEVVDSHKSWSSPFPCSPMNPDTKKQPLLFAFNRSLPTKFETS